MVWAHGIIRVQGGPGLIPDRRFDPGERGRILDGGRDVGNFGRERCKQGIMLVGKSRQAGVKGVDALRHLSKHEAEILTDRLSIIGFRRHRQMLRLNSEAGGGGRARGGGGAPKQEER